MYEILLLKMFQGSNVIRKFKQRSRNDEIGPLKLSSAPYLSEKSISCLIGSLQRSHSKDLALIKVTLELARDAAQVLIRFCAAWARVVFPSASLSVTVRAQRWPLLVSSAWLLCVTAGLEQIPLQEKGLEDSPQPTLWTGKCVNKLSTHVYS